MNRRGRRALQLKKADVARYERRKRVADMYLRGQRSIRQIAAALGVNPSTVSRDVHAIVEEWQKEYAGTFEVLRVQMAAKYSRIDTELWSAWEASKTKGGRLKVHVSGSADEKDKDGNPVMTGTAKIRKEQSQYDRYGDPRIMELILRTAEGMRQLFGLDQPPPAESDANKGGLSLTMIVQQVEQRRGAQVIDVDFVNRVIDSIPAPEGESNGKGDSGPDRDGGGLGGSDGSGHTVAVRPEQEAVDREGADDGEGEGE